MIEIDDKIVSLELFTARFCCDLQACRGICCVEGNSGAPLDPEEKELLKEQWPNYVKYMKPEGIKAIEEQGFAILDDDGDLTTPLINDAECAYSIETESGTWCAIEKAFLAGECSYHKPISCHLYPIREAKFSTGSVGLQYHRWDVCRAAEILGKTKGEPLFRTLKAPIIRRYGSEFFKQLEAAEELLIENKYL